MRLQLRKVAAAMSHNQCVHIGVRALGLEADELPPLDERLTVVHARLGGGYPWPQLSELNQAIQSGQVYELDRGLFARLDQLPDHADDTQLQLFGIVRGGVSLVHSLGSHVQWFEGAQQLLYRAYGEHVRGNGAEAFGDCWRPDLNWFHDGIQALFRASATPKLNTPGEWYVLPELQAARAAS